MTEPAVACVPDDRHQAADRGDEEGFWASTVQLTDRIDDFLGAYVGKKAHFGFRRTAFGILTWVLTFTILFITYPPRKDLVSESGARLPISVWYTCITLFAVGPTWISACIAVRADCMTVGEMSNAGAASTRRSKRRGSDTITAETAIVPAPCNVVAPAISAPSNNDSALNAATAVSTAPPFLGAQVRLRPEACAVAAQWYMSHVVVYSLCYAAISIKGGAGIATFLHYIVGLCLLRRKAKKWNPTRGARAVRFYALRVYLPGLPLIVGPLVFIPPLLDRLPVGTVLAVFPLLISFGEFLFIEFVLSDRAVRWTGDHYLSIFARVWAVSCASLRVGMLVVVSNFSKDFDGLVVASAVGAALEILTTRLNLVEMSTNTLGYYAKRLLSRCGLMDRPQQTAMEAANPPLKRGKRVYLSVKREAELLPVVTLLLMKLFGFGHPTGLLETGELRPELDCSWKVLGVVAGLEVAGELVGVVLAWAIARWIPALKVDIPNTVQPSDSVVVLGIVWIYMGYTAFLTMGSMGLLVEGM